MRSKFSIVNRRRFEVRRLTARQFLFSDCKVIENDSGQEAGIMDHWLQRHF